jgi:hypothetical protein
VISSTCTCSSPALVKYRVVDVTPPVQSMKLKIIYGIKVSKIADLGTFFIQTLYTYMCRCTLVPMRLVSRGGG